MKSNNYITIQGWMRTELDLKGNDLLVYAIIYGFSQDKESKFTGSLKYLADWCGATKQGIQKNLSNLLERGLIEKEEELKNGLKICSYSCTPCNSVVHPIQLSCTNNIDNTLDSNTDILSKDNIYSTDGVSSKAYTEEDFLGSAKKRKPVSKKTSNLYQKCLDEIGKYTGGKFNEVSVALETYLKLRLSMHDKPIYGVGQWIGILKRLDEILQSPSQNAIDVINQSLQRGWATFFPVPNKARQKEVFSEYGEVTCEKSNGEESSGIEY